RAEMHTFPRYRGLVDGADQRLFALERRGVDTGPAFLQRFDQISALPAARAEGLRTARVKTAPRRWLGRIRNLATRQHFVATAARHIGQWNGAEQRARIRMIGVVEQRIRGTPFDEIAEVENTDAVAHEA